MDRGKCSFDCVPGTGIPSARVIRRLCPHRHVGSIFELGSEEQASIWNLVADIRNRLKYRPDAPPDIAAWAYEHAHR